MGAPSRPTVIIDECLPAHRFRTFFEGRGYTVLTVGEAFPSGSPDAAVLALAVSREAVVISTDQDWRKLIGSAAGHRGKVRRAGRILFNCHHHRAFPRLEMLIDDIEREYDAAIAAGRTLLIRITESTFTVEK